MLAAGFGLSRANADCGNVFTFADFASSSDLTLVGTAEIADNKLRLNSAGQDGAGAAWFTASQASFRTGFTTTFTFSIENGTADGFAFLIQNESSDALGSGGSGIGYEGISSSVAIEFDTFGFGDEFPTPHISVQTRGIESNLFDDASSIAHRVLPFWLGDGPHDVKIEYIPGVLNIWIDGDPWLFASLDLQSILGSDNILSEDGCAWVGFTGGAGAATADQWIENWSFDDFSQVESCENVDLDGGGHTPDPETGDRVMLEWNVTGSGPKHYNWRIHDGAFFLEDDRHTGTTTTRMIIDPWIPADAVKYDFEAGNECSGLGVGSFEPGIRCPGDLNYDDFVDDADFVLFLPAYDTLIVPDADRRCDWNGDRMVDDTDFTYFVRYYNDLLCYPE